MLSYLGFESLLSMLYLSVQGTYRNVRRHGPFLNLVSQGYIIYIA